MELNRCTICPNASLIIPTFVFNCFLQENIRTEYEAGTQVMVMTSQINNF